MILAVVPSTAMTSLPHERNGLDHGNRDPPHVAPSDELVDPIWGRVDLESHHGSARELQAGADRLGLGFYAFTCDDAAVLVGHRKRTGTSEAGRSKVECPDADLARGIHLELRVLLDHPAE